MKKLLVCAAVLVLVGGAMAATPSPVMTLTLPDVGANAFGPVSARYSSTGLLYVWDGQAVWRQNGVNVDGFTQIGNVDLDGGAVKNSADPGPINFSRDGSQILVGNGGGGWAPYLPPYDNSWAGLIMTMPIAGGTVTSSTITIPYHGDIVAVPATSTIPSSATKYYADQGDSSYSGSSVSIFDTSTGSNRTVVANIPGATASMALDGAGDLYATVGFGDSVGVIHEFTQAQLDAAYASGTPIDWSAGAQFEQSAYDGMTSGAGLFLDSRGYLFGGGNGGVTVFRPDGTAQFYDLGVEYATVAYNPLNGQFIDLADGSVYSAADFVPEPASMVLLLIGGLAACRRKRMSSR